MKREFEFIGWRVFYKVECGDGIYDYNCGVYVYIEYGNGMVFKVMEVIFLDGKKG